MTWIRVDDTLPHSHKILESAAVLKIDPSQMLGHVLQLWLWCTREAIDGNLDQFSDETIAYAAGVRPNHPFSASDFVAALQLKNLLDGKCVHNWEEHQGRLIERQRADRERKQKGRERSRPHSAPASEARRRPDTLPSADVLRTSCGHPAVRNVTFSADVDSSSSRVAEEEEVYCEQPELSFEDCHPEAVAAPADQSNSKNVLRGERRNTERYSAGWEAYRRADPGALWPGQSVVDALDLACSVHGADLLAESVKMFRAERKIQQHTAAVFIVPRVMGDFIGRAELARAKARPAERWTCSVCGRESSALMEGRRCHKCYEARGKLVTT